MDLEKRKRWKKTKYKVPTMRILKDTAEIAALIERDHQAECAMYRAEQTSNAAEPLAPPNRRLLHRFRARLVVRAPKRRRRLVPGGGR